jgi:hypothetical protein
LMTTNNPKHFHLYSFLETKGTTHPHTMLSGWFHLGMLRSYAEVTHLSLLGYAKTVGTSSYNRRQQCHQCLWANKQHTQILVGIPPPPQKKVHGVFEKIWYVE